LLGLAVLATTDHTHYSLFRVSFNLCADHCKYEYPKTMDTPSLLASTMLIPIKKMLESNGRLLTWNEQCQDVYIPLLVRELFTLRVCCREILCWGHKLVPFVVLYLRQLVWLRRTYII
jgi:hypothetical protein